LYILIGGFAMKDQKKLKKSGKKGKNKKENHKSVEPERGFIPYFKRFINTCRSTYREINSL